MEAVAVVDGEKAPEGAGALPVMNLQSKEGWSATITGIEDNAGIKGAVFSALGMSALNLRKDKNYTLLISSDGHGNLRISTDAPKDVIEPELAKIREATARGDEYHGNVSGLIPTQLTEYTLGGLTDNNIRKYVRSALWVKDMRTGGKNQQFSGVSAGIDGAGIARALVRSDDMENNPHLSSIFSNAEARQQKVSALHTLAEEARNTSKEEERQQRIHSMNIKAASERDKDANQDAILSGHIRDMAAKLATTTDPKEARKLRKGLERTRSKIQKAARRKALRNPSSPLFRGRVYEQKQAAYAAREIQEQAKRDYIKANPTSIVAYEEVAKQQKINNRADKARLFAAEQTPWTPEFQAKVFRGLKTQNAREGAIEKFIEQNPNSRLAVKKRQHARARSRQKAKRFGGRAVHAARNAVNTAIGAILTLITTGVMLLTKSYQIITQIGNDVRKRSLNEAKFNFAPDTVRGFEIFAAERGGMDKDLLVRAAGGIQAAWSTPLNYAESGFNHLAPYLRENTVHLTRMATADGDANVFGIMSLVVDDLVSQSLRGVGGAKSFDPSSAEGRHRAFSANLNALSSHNEAWGELMNLYWQDFLSSGASSIAAWSVADRNGQMRSMSFENWVTQADWSQQYQKDTGISSPVIRDTARETHGLVANLVGTVGNLGTDIATGLAGYFGQIVENLRNIVDNWLAPYFPAFAMKENQRAAYLNTQSQMLANSLLPGYEAEAKRAIFDIGYDYGLPQFREVIDAIGRGDTSDIPYNVDLAALRDKMGVFTRYYHVQDILKNIEAENAKTLKDKNYVQKHIVGTASSIATVSGIQALVLQNRLDTGVVNRPLRLPDADTQFTAGDLGKQVLIGLANVPNFVGKVVSMAASASDTARMAMLKTRIERAQKSIDNSTNKDGSFTTSVARMRLLYNEMENSLRGLANEYTATGDRENFMFVVKRIWEFYRNYPEEISGDVVRRQEINEKIERDTEGLQFGKEFAERAKRYHPADLAAMVDNFIRQEEAQAAYEEAYTGLVSRDAAQQKTTREATVAGFCNKVEERLDAEADLSRNPDLESMYRWLSANIANTIHVDAFDEQKDRAMSDIVVNFLVDGAVKHTVRIPNTYGATRDVSLRHGSSIFSDLTPMLEAYSATQ
jgi:hypothetical protein